MSPPFWILMYDVTLLARTTPRANGRIVQRSPKGSLAADPPCGRSSAGQGVWPITRQVAVSGR